MDQVFKFELCFENQLIMLKKKLRVDSKLDKAFGLLDGAFSWKWYHVNCGMALHLLNSSETFGSCDLIFFVQRGNLLSCFAAINYEVAKDWKQILSRAARARQDIPRIPTTKWNTKKQKHVWNHDLVFSVLFCLCWSSSLHPETKTYYQAIRKDI